MALLKARAKAALQSRKIPQPVSTLPIVQPQPMRMHRPNPSDAEDAKEHPKPVLIPLRVQVRTLQQAERNPQTLNNSQIVQLCGLLHQKQ